MEITAPGSLLLTIISIIFTAGVTWGITSNRQKTSDKGIGDVIQELKTVVGKLQDLATEVQVAKTLSIRFEKDLQAQEDRIRSLETQVAKLSR